MERVKILSGKIPVILVAPHGHESNDEKTALITETIAESIGSYAVINQGWERDKSVDFIKDKADCNNVLHCHEDVVKDEFLDPILRFKSKILKKYNSVFIFYIHGMSNKHRIMANDPSMDIVVGYGLGIPSSLTCEEWKKDLLIHLLESAGIIAYESSSGGAMSGWARNNMNQLFRKWYYDARVQCMQIEIIHELREDDTIAKITAEHLGDIIKLVSEAKAFTSKRCNRMY
jgi:alpha-amylase/alpha-mannosidase (GH57 family)